MTCPNCRGTLPEGAIFCGACGTRLEAVSGDPLVDRVVGGRYRVLRRLGAGGMGSVYAAEQVSLKRPAALKLLNPDLFSQPDLVRRFHAEAELAARLSHPNTVTLYDFGQAEDGSLYIAMELVTGPSLRQVLGREGPLPPLRAVDIAEQVAASLWDAHQNGIVHRDLKPDNVMLSERAGRRDFVRVVDFGIAKLRDERPGGVSGIPQTHSGSILGTPQYMAPEQISGGHVDGRTDVYAMGCMLYEVVTGRVAFQGPTVTAVLAQQLNETPPPPDAIRPDLRLPPPLTALIMRCLAKDPDARPPSMEAVKAELAGLRAQLVGGAPVAHPLPTPAPPPQTFAAAQVVAGPGEAAARPPSQLWMAALAVGVVLIAAAITIGRLQWQWDPELPASEEGDVEPDEGEEAKATPAPAAPGLGLSDADLSQVFAGGLESNPTAFGARRGAPGASPATLSNAKFGYTVALPSGFSAAQARKEGAATAVGTIAGKTALIITYAQAADGSHFQGSAMELLSESLVSNANATLVKKGTRRVGGTDLLSILADLDQLAMRAEIVLYVRPTFILAVAVGAQKDAFEGTASLRDHFFADNVRFR